MTKKNKCVVIFSFFVLMLSLSSCHSTSTANKYDDVPMNNYYKIEDFQSIIIGESTYKDVYEIASTETIQITSYGGFCEYPMQNGGYICVKFYGRELVVGDVEEIPENAQGTVQCTGDGSSVLWLHENNVGTDYYWEANYVYKTKWEY